MTPSPHRTAAEREFAGKARSAGYLAAMKGKDIEACPYRSLSRQDDWIAGYREYLKRMKEVKK